MHFSSRVGSSELNPVSEAEQDFKTSGQTLVNLSDSNPTRYGLGPATLPGDYSPDPRGPLRAREELAAFIARDQGRMVDPQHLYLLSSTSQAYAWLIKLFCDPGDSVASPAPGYPLVESIARLEGVGQASYHLHRHGRWQLDLAELERLLSDDDARIRAVIAINPNNPTGSYLADDERDELVALCAQFDVPLIADEVFYGYGFGTAPRRLAGESGTLTFALDGLSKQLAAPHAKVAWIEVSGPAGRVTQAQSRLDVVADAFLPMSDLIAAQLPELLAAVPQQRSLVGQRTARNLDSLLDMVSADPTSPMSVLVPEGGWSALLRFPSMLDEDELVTGLIAESGVSVQPGYFFDMPGDGYVSVSLLLEPAIFDRCVAALLAQITSQLRR